MGSLLMLVRNKHRQQSPKYTEPRKDPPLYMLIETGKAALKT